MTPEMAKRVEFLREAAAKGYSMRWAAGELGIKRKTIQDICYRNGIRMADPRAVLATTRRRQLNQPRYWHFHLTHVEASDYEDFLPDVGGL